MNRSAESPLLWLILQEKCFTIGNQERNNGRYGWCRGEEGELAVKQKKTASMKQKFAYMAVTMVAASLGVFLCLYLVVSGIMGQTRQIMDDNDRNARFQTQMRQEEKRSAIGLRETMGMQGKSWRTGSERRQKLLKN